MGFLISRTDIKEKERLEDLVRIVPKGRSTLLDIGARDGYISMLLSPYFDVVTALDLEKPDIDIPNVISVKGDVTNVGFSDDYFDVVLCSEVLEHIRPELLERACSEIARVAKYDVIIGTPYRQDLRIGRTVCLCCGHENPPWGHLNTFDEKKQRGLFKALTNVLTSYIGKEKARTNFLSAYLMSLAGNPWGTYDQEEPCVNCGKKLSIPLPRSIRQRFCSKTAALLTEAQLAFMRPSPIWMHMVFMKKPFACEREG